MTAVTFDSPAGAPARRSRQFRQLRYAGVLAKRNLIKLVRTPEQFIDVTLQPIIFLVLFYYVLGGALGGSLGGGALATRHGYLEFLLPGLLAQTIAMSSISIGQNMNADIEKGVFDRFRSLPIGRAIPLVGAVLAEFFRYLLVVVITIGFGYILGFRVETNSCSLAGGDRARDLLRARLRVDLGLGRAEDAQRRVRPGRDDAAGAAADVRQQHLRARC